MTAQWAYEQPQGDPDLQVKPNKRPMIPAGSYYLRLVDVHAQEVPSLAHQKDPGKYPNPKEIKWAWRFEANVLDPEGGLPYEHTVWTNDRYGNPKANLTKLLDFVIPRATKEQKEQLRPRLIYGRWWEAQVIWRPSQTSGRMMAEVAFWKEVPKGFTPQVAVPAPAAPEEDSGDSFDGEADPVLAAQVAAALRETPPDISTEIPY